MLSILDEISIKTQYTAEGYGGLLYFITNGKASYLIHEGVLTIRQVKSHFRDSTTSEAERKRHSKPECLKYVRNN
jgi:hypothetical protein